MKPHVKLNSEQKVKLRQHILTTNVSYHFCQYAYGIPGYVRDNFDGDVYCEAGDYVVEFETEEEKVRFIITSL